MNFKFSCALAFISLFSSCQVYRSDFDCPPAVGVPCTSVTDIQKMIIETPDGYSDIFADCIQGESNYVQCGCKSHATQEQYHRIWVADSCTENTSVQGHYIFFTVDQK